MGYLLSLGSVIFFSPLGKGNRIRAYEKFVDYLVGGTTPQSVLDYRPSDTTKARVADLIRRQKTTSLSLDETAELNQYLQIKQFIKTTVRSHSGDSRLNFVLLNVEEAFALQKSPDNPEPAPIAGRA